MKLVGKARRGEGEVASVICLVIIFAVGCLLAYGFASGGTIGPGPATRAIAESDTLGLWGKYLAVTFFGTPADIAFWVVVVSVIAYIVIAVAFKK